MPVVVDMTTTMQETKGLVIVGIDGSEESLAALRWAADEARQRDARLRLVHGWTIPAAAYTASVPTALLPSLPDVAVYRQAADARVARALASIDVTTLPRGVEHVISNAQGANAILEASEDADLIVLGSRGRSTLNQVLLGSVSQKVLKDATVPVVV